MDVFQIVFYLIKCMKISLLISIKHYRHPDWCHKIICTIFCGISWLDKYNSNLALSALHIFNSYEGMSVENVVYWNVCLLKKPAYLIRLHRKWRQLEALSRTSMLKSSHRVFIGSIWFYNNHKVNNIHLTLYFTYPLRSELGFYMVLIAKRFIPFPTRQHTVNDVR